MSDLTIRRLSKVAREFNVGITTIVEYLEKKGHPIDSNPNSKVSQECYDLLLKEYSSDINIKKESEKLMLKKIKEKKESLSIDDIKNTSDDEETELDDMIHIKDVSGSSKKLTHEIKKKDDRTEIKVIGKIDLDSLNQKTRPTKRRDEDYRHEEHKIEHHHKAQHIVEQPIIEQQQHQEVVHKLEHNTLHKEENKIEYKEEPILETNIRKEESEKETVEIQNIEVIQENTFDNFVEEKQHIEQDTVSVDVVETTVPVFEEVKTNNDQELFVIEQVKKENEVKVIGRIDLDALNQKTRPAKKTKTQREDERRDKERQRREMIDKEREKRYQQENQRKAEENKKNPTEHRHEHELKKEPAKIELRLVGKMDLPQDQEKKKILQTDDRKSRKKRKRIHKDVVPPEKSDKDQPKKILLGSDGKPKEKIQLKLVKKGQHVKKLVKKEVNDDDVQKQIRETLAKLTTKGKSKAAKHRREKRDEVSRKMQEEVEQNELNKKILKVTEFVSANELASMMDMPVNQIIATCMELGSPVSINQRLDAETISILASEYGYEVEFISLELQDTIMEEEDRPEDLEHRAPIVTVMGHVDHGKTSLLDYIRNTNVIAGEAGGITQHIGAYNVTLKDGKKITFLDTPGHEAFTAMRARGAKITDIVIIVISADDNVMPQTIEAINHAQAAGVPIVFAINKIDKPGANPDRIKEALSKMNYLIEEWGGKYQSQDISAKKGLNVEALLEKVLLEAEMLELKANHMKRGVGSVIESELDKGRGFMVTLLVQNGCVKVGDVLLAGSTYGRVKAMYNERNVKVHEIGPSEPVVILGLNGAPQAGDKFNIMASEREAKEIANRREQLQRELGRRAQKHITLDEIGRRIAIGNFKELNIIVKGDVDGSIEALSDALIRLSSAQIQLNIIHKAVGQISENDVMLAAASNAIIVGFQVRPSLSARKVAEKEGIDVRLYSVIYNAINEIKDAMEGMLSPEIKEDIIGTAEIREVYKITKVGTVAGCMVKDGKILRTAKIRVIRDGIVIFTGELASLKRFKDDAKEVAKGFECGLNVNKFNDIKVGDFIEAFTETEVKIKL